MKKAIFSEGKLANVINAEKIDMGICTCPTNCDCRQKCCDSSSAKMDQIKLIYKKQNIPDKNN